MIPDELIDYLYANIDRFKASAAHANKTAQKGKTLTKRDLDIFVRANAMSHASIIVLEILEAVETKGDMNFAISRLHSSLDRSLLQSELMLGATVYNRAITLLEKRR